MVCLQQLPCWCVCWVHRVYKHPVLLDAQPGCRCWADNSCTPPFRWPCSVQGDMGRRRSPRRRNRGHSGDTVKPRPPQRWSQGLSTFWQSPRCTVVPRIENTPKAVLCYVWREIHPEKDRLALRGKRLWLVCASVAFPYTHRNTYTHRLNDSTNILTRYLRKTSHKKTACAQFPPPLPHPHLPTPTPQHKLCDKMLNMVRCLNRRRRVSHWAICLGALKGPGETGGAVAPDQVGVWLLPAGAGPALHLFIVPLIVALRERRIMVMATSLLARND